MKKILSLVLTLALVLSLVPAVHAAEAAEAIDTLTQLGIMTASEDIPVYLDTVKLSQGGIIVSDRTYLPVRALCEALGMDVDWNNDTRSVLIGTKPEATEKTDAVNIYLDGVKMENAEAIIVNDFTYLPVRALCEALEKEVEWNNDTREVYVTTPDADAFNGKYFRLKHVATDRYLCVESAKTEDGAKVVVANRDDSNSNQVWGFTAMDDGFYKIFNQNSKKSIDISAFSTVPGVELTQYSANGGTNQQVKPVLNEDGTYTIIIRHSGLAITATDRFTTQEALTGDSTQAFEFEYVGQTPMGNLTESAGYLALDPVTKERFDSFVYTTLPFGVRVQSEV